MTHTNCIDSVHAAHASLNLATGAPENRWVDSGRFLSVYWLSV